MKIFGGKGALVAAVALGALTSYIAWRYIDQASQQSNQQAEMTPVVVARVAIPARTVITPELVRIQQLPVDAAHVQAAHSINQVVGKVVKSDVVADEQILSSRLFLQRGESGLAFMIPDGMRAISVAFSEIVGSGGMVVPGDHVDVIGVFEAKGPITTNGQQASQTNEQKQDPSTTIATLVLQNVQVLAVAQRLEGQDTAKKDEGPSLPVPGTQQPQTPSQQVRAEPAPQPGAKTATLALSPEDALKMVLAEGKGQVRLALRPANDKSTPNVPQVPMSVLLSPPQSTSAAAPASAH